MPEQQISGRVLDEFLKLPEGDQRKLLGTMSDATKRALLTQIQSRPKAAPTMGPNRAEFEEGKKRQLLRQQQLNYPAVGETGGKPGTMAGQDTGIIEGVKRGLSGLAHLPATALGLNDPDTIAGTIYRGITGPPGGLEADLKGRVEAAQEQYRANQPREAMESQQDRGLALRPSQMRQLVDVIGNAVPGGSPAPIINRAIERDALGAAAEAGTMIAGTAAVAKGLPALRDSGPARALTNRISTAYLGKGSSTPILGADPVAAMQSLPVAMTRGGFLKNVRTALTEQEGLLQRAIADRNAALGPDAATMGGMDVGPAIKAAYEKLASAEGTSPGTSRELRSLGKRRIAGLVERHGSTYLTPEQILAEKRLLSKEVKFSTQDTVQLNKNAANANAYKAYDSALDELVPAAKDINKRYSGMIELEGRADDLLAADREAPFMFKRGGLFETVTSKFPQTLPTTTANRVLNLGRTVEGTALTGGPYPRYQKPVDYLRTPEGGPVERRVPLPGNFPEPPVGAPDYLGGAQPRGIKPTLRTPTGETYTIDPHTGARIPKKARLFSLEDLRD